MSTLGKWKKKDCIRPKLASNKLKVNYFSVTHLFYTLNVYLCLAVNHVA